MAPNPLIQAVIVDGVINCAADGNAFGNFDTDEPFPGVPESGFGNDMFGFSPFTQGACTAR